MAGSNRRLALAAILLPVLFIAMSGLAHAIPVNVITVNTLDSGSQPAPLCTLEDAVLAAETQFPQNGCVAGTGNDEIHFIVTGTIFLENTLLVNNPSESLAILGPPYGGITIDGQFNFELVDVEDSTFEVENLTFTRGANVVGGDLFAGGSELFIVDCTFMDSEADEGGAIFNEDSLIDLVNDTFFEDFAFAGGAIANGDGGTFITNATFSDNEAEFGADVATDIGETLANSSIFANSLVGGNCDGVGDAGYNISDDNSCGFSGTSVNNSTMLKLDPMGLQSNGGPTQTIALESGSQAIDFVPIAQCLAFPGVPVTNDQRLFDRPDPANLNFCDAGAYEFGAVAPVVLATKSERVQIARSSNPNSDKVNIAFSFTINSNTDCDSDDDALNAGFDVSLFQGTCATIPATGLELMLSPFVVHTVHLQSYGTFFQTFGPETVSARLVALAKPPAPACGEWTLNLEVAGANTGVTGPGALNLAGGNPFALVVTDLEGDDAGCFDINNAIVGGQLPTRKVRRQTRR
jgi:hypothetical protein